MSLRNHLDFPAWVKLQSFVFLRSIYQSDRFLKSNPVSGTLNPNEIKDFVCFALIDDNSPLAEMSHNLKQEWS